MSTLQWYYCKDSNKNVSLPKRVLLDESRYFAGIINHEQDFVTLSVFVKYVEAFENHLLPVLDNNELEWKDIKVTDGKTLCYLMQTAEFLGMEELLFEVQKRIRSAIMSVMPLEQFNPECISKVQVKNFMFNYVTSEKCFKLELLFEWLKGSSTEFIHEMKIWFEKALGESWVSELSSENISFNDWNYVINEYPDMLRDFFTIKELMDIVGNCTIYVSGECQSIKSSSC